MSFSIKNESQGAGIAKVLLYVAIVVVIFIVVGKFFKGIDGLLQKIGLQDSKEEKENKEKVSNAVDKESTKGNESAWSPRFYQGAPYGAVLLTASSAESLAKRMWDSVGYFVDSPSKGAGVIRQLKTKAQVSHLAHKFFQKYGIDLLPWLQNKYDTSEQKEYLADMLRHVEALPKWR